MAAAQHDASVCGCDACLDARAEAAPIWTWDCSCQERGIIPAEKRFAQLSALAHRAGRVYHFTSIHRARRA